jgi:hypothetical protein
LLGGWFLAATPQTSQPVRSPLGHSLVEITKLRASAENGDAAGASGTRTDVHRRGQERGAAEGYVHASAGCHPGDLSVVADRVLAAV